MVWLRIQLQEWCIFINIIHKINNANTINYSTHTMNAYQISLKQKAVVATMYLILYIRLYPDFHRQEFKTIFKSTDSYNLAKNSALNCC